MAIKRTDDNRILIPTLKIRLPTHHNIFRPPDRSCNNFFVSDRVTGTEFLQGKIRRVSVLAINAHQPTSSLHIIVEGVGCGLWAIKDLDIDIIILDMNISMIIPIITLSPPVENSNTSRTT